MAWSGPELTRSLKHAHATLRDSFSFYLKDRTSIRRLTTPYMGKKDKQKLEHKASQSPCTPLVFINLSLVLIATYYKPISPNITLLGCHP